MILGWNTSVNNMLTIWKMCSRNTTKYPKTGKVKKIAGIDLQCHYPVRHRDRTCRLSLKHYIAYLLLKLGQPMPKKPQLSPHKCKTVNYGSRIQIAPEADDSKPLDDKGIRRVDQVVGALLWVGRSVNNKLVVALSAIGSQQASDTEETNKAITQLLDYCTTYPDDGILYRASDMILFGHSYSEFNNKTKAKSRAGAHIFCLKMKPFLVGIFQ